MITMQTVIPTATTRDSVIAIATTQYIVSGSSPETIVAIFTKDNIIQWLIYEKFGVEYSVYYIPQLLKNMGFSYQKAKLVADHNDPQKRKQWLEQKWPEILKLAEKKNAYICLARYHTSKAMKQFFANKANRITVHDLPSYSPDYNAIEKLWKKN